MDRPRARGDEHLRSIEIAARQTFERPFERIDVARCRMVPNRSSERSTSAARSVCAFFVTL
jgi:hypothetical protein